MEAALRVNAIMGAEFTRPETSSLPRHLLPASCALCCRTCDLVLCEACARQLLGANGARCRRCGLRISGGHECGHCLCGHCLATPPSYDATVIGIDYGPPADQLLAGLKYRGALEVATLCASLLVPKVQIAQLDLLCPVPLAPLRLARRGYNQALEIARLLARRCRIQLAPRLLQRTRETPAQTQLPASERARNLKGAFVVLPAQAALLAGRAVGVVDDVMTTGSTLEEAARVLKRFGAASVTNIVFARTPAQGTQG